MYSEKKEYLSPQTELIYFNQSDIITTSVPDKNEDDDGWTAV